jgi:hypothetical protein
MEWSAKLRADWGDKPCDHPELLEERDCEGDTGIFVCTTCGESRWGAEWNKKPAS